MPKMAQVSVELPQNDPSDVTKTALFQQVRSTPSVPDPMADKREFQASADEILSKFGTRAVAPQEGESAANYAAVIGTQLAALGPPERRSIDRVRLAKEAPSALAEIVRMDREFALQEIDRPRHSLKPGEARAVEKIDRSGRSVTEWYSHNDSPSFWMNTFKEPVVRYVSGGSAGIRTNASDGTYRFDKENVVPELREAARLEALKKSPEYQIAEAYRLAGVEPPR